MSDENRGVNENERPSRTAATPAAVGKVEAKHAEDEHAHPDDRDHDDHGEHHDDHHEEHGDHHEDHDEDHHGEPHDDQHPAPARREELRQPLGPADEYQFQVHFDRQSRRYWGTVAEFPEIRMAASSPEAALEDVRMAVEDHVELVRRRNEPVPEPMGLKVYPQAITLNLSQGLYRRLDALSRYEKVALEQLVGELLSGAVEKRFEPNRAGAGQQNRQPPHGRDGGSSGNHSRNDGGNRRNGPQGSGNHGGAQGGGHRNNRGSRSSEMMENRESFMEYVRNLEKSGGPTGGGSGGGRDGGGRGGWKKR